MSAFPVKDGGGNHVLLRQVIAENPKLLGGGASSQLSVGLTLARTVLTPPGRWWYCSLLTFCPVSVSVLFLSAAPPLGPAPPKIGAELSPAQGKQQPFLKHLPSNPHAYSPHHCLLWAFGDYMAVFAGGFTVPEPFIRQKFMCNLIENRHK